MAPRHPPRALCSLTSISSSPNGQVRWKVQGLHLIVTSAEIEGFDFFYRSRLHLLRFWPLRAGPAIRWSVTSSRSSSPLIRRWRAGGLDTHRRLEVTRAVWDSRGSCECCRGLPDIRLAGSGSKQGWFLLLRRSGGREMVVETRRLELLTLSLQRRRSSI